MILPGKPNSPKTTEEFRNLAGSRGRYLISSSLKIFKRKIYGLVMVPLIKKKNYSYYPVWRCRHLVKIEPDKLESLWRQSNENKIT